MLWSMEVFPFQSRIWNPKWLWDGFLTTYLPHHHAVSCCIVCFYYFFHFHFLKAVMSIIKKVNSTHDHYRKTYHKTSPQCLMHLFHRSFKRRNCLKIISAFLIYTSLVLSVLEGHYFWWNNNMVLKWIMKNTHTHLSLICCMRKSSLEYFKYLREFSVQTISS